MSRQCERKKGRDATGRHERMQGRPGKKNLSYRSLRYRGRPHWFGDTVAIQSFLNAGFRITAQVEFVVIVGGGPSSHYKGSPISEFQEFCS